MDVLRALDCVVSVAEKGLPRDTSGAIPIVTECIQISLTFSSEKILYNSYCMHINLMS